VEKIHGSINDTERYVLTQVVASGVIALAATAAIVGTAWQHGVRVSRPIVASLVLFACFAVPCGCFMSYGLMKLFIIGVCP
jgi:predicted exporter